MRTFFDVIDRAARWSSTVLPDEQRQYDRWLYDQIGELNRMVADYSAYRDSAAGERSRQRFVERGLAWSASLRKRRAPTSDWQALAADYADRMDEMVHAVEGGHDRYAEFEETGRLLLARRDELRRRYAR